MNIPARPVMGGMSGRIACSASAFFGTFLFGSVLGIILLIRAAGR